MTSSARFPTSDIVYNGDLGLWQCCHSAENITGKTDCAHPGSDSFQAAPPQSLSAQPSYTPHSSTLATAPTPSPTTSSLEAAAISSPPQSSSGLSTGIKVGVGVGAVVGGLTVIAALIFCILKFQRKGRRQQQAHRYNGKTQKLDPGPESNAPQRYVVEVDGRERQPELDGRARSEL